MTLLLPHCWCGISTHCRTLRYESELSPALDGIDEYISNRGVYMVVAQLPASLCITISVAACTF